MRRKLVIPCCMERAMVRGELGAVWAAGALKTCKSTVKNKRLTAQDQDYIQIGPPARPVDGNLCHRGTY
ncbi:Protein of unknown function [Pyronema omphalodes CBS 100304]|uniref:Uncharacterized protein n=1 Tax=Pyronema omphalodes (strain CBS 100304) TaxID=1076935 RepID=U4L4E5_PYROM|nr:Protein of unknown function [Pyronema omphalodes CBS 100304]